MVLDGSSLQNWMTWTSRTILIVLLSSTKQQIQDKTTRLEEGARRMGLKINKEKTKAMRINATNQEKIIINGQDIEDVDEFVYLGAKGGGMKDLKNRLSKARGPFNKIKKIWMSNNILKKTKVRLHKTLVVPVLLYGSETWKMNKGDDKTVNVFHNRCLRKILRIRWQDNLSTRSPQKLQSYWKVSHLYEATESGSDVS